MKIEIITNRTGIYGGLRRLYILAEYFLEAGHEVVLNIRDGSKTTWFHHNVPENRAIVPDVRIIQEVMQEHYIGAYNILYYQAHWDVPEGSYDAIVTTSTFLKEELAKHGYPSITIPYGFDSNLFRPTPENRKRGLIAYMPRKNNEEIQLIKQLLPTFVDPKKFEFLAIDGCNETQVASLLQKSDIFLAVSRTEGFGCPPAEAALCGTLVVGYHGKGGKDWMTPSTYIPAKDPMEIISNIKHVILNDSQQEIRANARHAILAEYNFKQEKEKWLKLLNSLVTGQK
jgi:glycosyltransferase involved in cell wall biosynthesis